MKPHLSKDAIDQAIAQICLMPFFPASDIQARAMLIQYFFNICHTDRQALWLASRYVTLFPKWAGLRELRAVASSKFKPRDGIEVYSESYSDGIPSEVESKSGLLPAGAEREIIESGKGEVLLLEGHVSTDAEADAMVLDMVPLKTMPKVSKFHHAVGDERRVENILRQMYHENLLPAEPPTPAIDLPPAPEIHFINTVRPPQRITASEVEAARTVELLRRERGEQLAES